MKISGLCIIEVICSRWLSNMYHHVQALLIFVFGMKEALPSGTETFILQTQV